MKPAQIFRPGAVEGGERRGELFEHPFRNKRRSAPAAGRKPEDEHCGLCLSAFKKEGLFGARFGAAAAHLFMAGRCKGEGEASVSARNGNQPLRTSLHAGQASNAPVLTHLNSCFGRGWTHKPGSLPEKVFQKFIHNPSAMRKINGRQACPRPKRKPSAASPRPKRRRTPRKRLRPSDRWSRRQARCRLQAGACRDRT